MLPRCEHWNGTDVRAECAGGPRGKISAFGQPTARPPGTHCPRAPADCYILLILTSLATADGLMPDGKERAPGNKAQPVACDARAQLTKVKAGCADRRNMSVTRCSACQDGVQKPMPFSMAFQPIVNVETGQPFAYEALIRGVNGESALSVLSQVTEANRYAFDQSCRVQAITIASRLRLQDTGAYLSINFLPGAVYSPGACIRLTLKTADECGFPLDRLIFGVTESEKVNDPNHLQAIAREYQRHGFLVAIDDFGAGHANLGLLASLSANVLKLDRELIRNLHLRPKAQALARHMSEFCRRFQIEMVAEGIETAEEYRAVRGCGIHLMQGFLLARPAFERLPEYSIPLSAPAAASPPVMFSEMLSI